MQTFQRLGPLGKTIAWCVLGEAVILALMFALTSSLAGALLLPLGLLGPVSAWVGPLILQHYRASEKLNRKTV